MAGSDQCLGAGVEMQSRSKGDVMPRNIRVKSRRSMLSARGLVSSIVAAAVVVTSAAPASAESYFFRYKQAVGWSPKPVDPANPSDPAFGVGNDITIFFTGPLGQPFSKVIPVKTTDVVEWRVQSGSLQEGLALDAAAGVVAGVPAGKTQQKKSVLVGYDVTGGMIARATISSMFHNPAGRAMDFTFYGHTDRYMYREIPATVPVAEWVPFGDLPAEFSTEGRYLAGTPRSEYNTQVGFIGYDYMGKEVAFTYGDLIVQDEPVVAHIPDQIRHPSKNFSLTASVQYKVGEIRYRVVALDGKPDHLSIGSKTGKLSAGIRTFNTSKRFRIEALDVDGTLGTSNVFTLSTSAPDVDLANMRDQTGTVNKPYLIQLTGKDLSGEQSWKVVQGELPLGLQLDPATGEIHGTPRQVEKKTGIVIAVSTTDGGSAQSSAFDFEIFPEDFGLTFDALDTRVNRPFVTAGPTFGSGIETPYSFELAAGETESEDVSVDYSAAVVSGQSETAGDYSVAFNFRNGDGREKVIDQPITIHDDLSLEYAPEIVAYRRIPADAAPTAVGVIGLGQFEIVSGTLPDGLWLDTSSGEIAGTAETVELQEDIAVKVTDESGESATSNSFQIEVQDRPDVVVLADGVEVERFIDNLVPAATAQNVFDGVTYELVAGTLPEGLALGEDGVIRGSTDELEGVYGGLQVQATDGEGYVGLSPVFSVTVVSPKALAPLDPQNNNSDIHVTWTQDVPFSFPLPSPSNAFGAVTYDIQSLPAGVAIVGDSLVGTISSLGDHVYQYTLIDETRRTLTGTYTITILEPMTAILEGRGKTGDEETDSVVFELPRGGDTVIAPQVSNAVGAVTYSFSGTLPDGLVHDLGKISGKPLVQDQTGDFILTVTDAAGTSVALHAGIVVGERVPLTLEYNPADPIGVAGQKMSALLPSVKDSIGTVAFDLTGTLPPGVEFDPATGIFFGTPTVPGWYQGLTVTATDSDGGSAYAGSYGPFAVAVGLAGQPSMASSTTFIVRAGKDFRHALDVGNALAPVVFSTSSGAAMPHGLVLGASDGSISGNLPLPGKYSAGSVVATDSLNRTNSTAVGFAALGPLAVAAPSKTDFNQYFGVSASPAATNVIGGARYDLVAGSLPGFLSLDPNTGTVRGPADEMGTWSGLVVRVTDSTGDAAETLPFSITIGPRLPLELNTDDSYTAVTSKSFKLTLPVLNAVGEVSHVLVGALPEGIKFDEATGVFSGQAMELGYFPVTVTVTDSKGASVTKSFTIVAETNGKPINLAVSDFVTRESYEITTRVPSYSNHVGAIRFWADDTLASHGLSIDPDTGVITGPATQLMDFTPNIHITDQSLRVTSKPINIKVVPDLAANVPARIDLFVNRRIYPYVYVSADNTTSPVEWSIEGTLPKGMSFSKSSRRFSGTPTEMGSFNVKLTVREKEGFMQSATASAEIVVNSDGLAPTVSVKPSASGYYADSNSTITPTYTNGKIGDVLSLAPDSAPLPPGFAFVQASGGKYVLKRPAGTEEDAGVYEGIKVRVTSTDGLYGESEPFTIILKSSFTYRNVVIDTRAYEPQAVKPEPIRGAPIGTPNFSFNKDGSQGTLTIDPATGLISGHVTKATTYMGVKVSDTYNGKLLRSVYYTLTFKAEVLSVSVPPTQVSFTGIAYPTATYPVVVSNQGTGAVLSLDGLVPAGLSVDPVTGALSGVTPTAGVYPVQLVYTDPNQTLSTPFTSVIEQAAPAGKGYKHLRIAVTSGSDHLSNLVIRSANGHNIMHLVSKGQGTIGDHVYRQLVGKHEVINFGSGLYQDFELPVPMDSGSIEAKGHGTATVAYSASVDGQTWVEIGTKVKSEAPTQSFRFIEVIPDLFAFNSVRLADADEGASYNFDLRTLVDTATLDGVTASDIVWSWKLDPNRNTSTTMPTLPQGLGINGSFLSGTPAEAGTYAVVLTGAHGGRQVTKALSLWIKAKSATGAFTDVSAGMGHTCAVTTAGGVKCWGSGTDGRLGTGNTTSYSYPVDVVGLSSVKAVAGSYDHTCALTTSGGVKCWGANDLGQLGNGNNTDSPTPVNVIGLGNGVVAISAGRGQNNGHTCALMDDGRVKCWGSNSAGQLGDGTKTDRNTPVYVDGLTRVAQISAGNTHTCSVTEAGVAQCWGSNSSGRLGDGTSKASLTPVDVVGMPSGVAMISAGRDHSCAVTNAGAAYCWGRGSYGQLGNGETLGSLLPAGVTGLGSGVAQIDAGHGSGYEQTCALTTSGGVKCWGRNTSGVLGDGTQIQREVPVDVVGLQSGVAKIALGYSTACALKDDGNIMCWGAGGRVGDGTQTTRNTPVDIVLK